MDPVDSLTAFNLIKSQSAKWRDIGRSLGLTLNDLDIIKQLETHSVNSRLDAVLNKWMERQTEPRWTTLITALRDAELVSLADDIKSKCTRDTSHDPPRDHRDTSSNDRWCTML